MSEGKTRFKLVWVPNWHRWVLMTPPCTSSDWDYVYIHWLDTIVKCRWKWPLKLFARWRAWRWSKYVQKPEEEFEV